MITNTSTNESTTTSNKPAFQNGNAMANMNSRYSPSHFYRAAAVAAVTSDPNNRRYMPNPPVSDRYLHLSNSLLSLFLFRSGRNRIVLVMDLNSNQM